jgi:hypothetical protein
MSTLSAELSSFADQMTLSETSVEKKISHIWNVLQVCAKFVAFVTFAGVVIDGRHRFKKPPVNG